MYVFALISSFFFSVPCQTGVVDCTEGVCMCRTGFAEPDCCKCANGYYRDGDKCKRTSVKKFKKFFVIFWLVLTKLQAANYIALNQALPSQIIP